MYVNVLKTTRKSNVVLSNYQDRLQTDIIYNKNYIQKTYTMLLTIVVLVIIFVFLSLIIMTPNQGFKGKHAR